MPGNKPLTGWGVEVLLPGKVEYETLLRPGTDKPLCTSLKGANAWLRDYRQRGCEARLVHVDTPRGASLRPRGKEEDVLEQKTLMLPGLDASFRDGVK